MTSKQMISEFRRFTNAVRKFGNGRPWQFVAEAEDDLVILIVNRRESPKRVAVVEALVSEWGGKIKERAQ